jgi:hypothetical protein
MANKTNKITQLIVVDADGEIITAANGLVSSDNRDLVRAVKIEAELGTEIQMVAPFGERIRANLEDPEDLLGITAALFSARPGRTRLLEAPGEVWEWFNDEDKHDGEGDSIGDAYSAEELETMIAEAEGFKSSDELAELLLAHNDEKDEESK